MPPDKVFGYGGCFREITVQSSAFLELQCIIKRLVLLQDISLRVVDEFGDIQGVLMASGSLSRRPLSLWGIEVGTAQARSPDDSAGDAHADIKQNIEPLNTQRENTTRDMAQVAALEVKLERVRGCGGAGKLSIKGLTLIFLCFPFQNVVFLPLRLEQVVDFMGSALILY